MKKITMVLAVVTMLFAPAAFAHEMDKSMPMADHAKMMTGYQCPMDGYVSKKAGKCPKCGMKLKKTEMTADQVKVAMDKQKETKQ